jgi:hypothetical protein
MDPGVIKEHNQWAERGYLTPLACPRHSWSPIVVNIDDLGLFWMCGFCGNRRHISAGEYLELQRKIKMVKELFKNGSSNARNKEG